MILLHTGLKKESHIRFSLIDFIGALTLKREKRIRLLTWALFLTIFILALEMLIAYLSTK